MASPITIVSMVTDFSEKLLVRSHKQISNKVNRFVMDYHWKEHIPLHFKAGAGNRYGYSRRDSVISVGWLKRSKPMIYSRIPRLTFEGRQTNLAKYKDVRNALGGGPLKWTGESEVRATSLAFRKITATSNRGRLQIFMPPYITSRVRLRDGQPMRQKQMQALERMAEIEVMTNGEITTLARQWRDEYVRIQTDASHPHHGLVRFRRRRRRR